MDILNEAELSANCLDVDCLALANSFQCYIGKPTKQADSVKALLNIGNRLTQVVIIRDGNLDFVRELQIGGADFTLAISTKLGIDMDAAEVAKLRPQERIEEIKAAAQAVLERFSNEVRLSFDYYENQVGKAVDEIYLSGGGSSFSGLAKFLKETVDLDVIMWNPLDKFELNPEISKQKMNELSTFFAVAAGLALR